MKKTMEVEKYYFYLESYIFVFLEAEKSLLYNVRTGEYLDFSADPPLLELLRQLKDTKNLYVVELSGEQLQIESVAGFVKAIKNRFWGDCIPSALCKERPVVFPPLLNFQLEKERTPNDLVDDTFRNLRELTICLTDVRNRVERDSIVNRQTSKQVFVGVYENEKHELPVAKILALLHECQIHDILVNLAGGDIFCYSSWELLKRGIVNTAKISFLSYYKDFYEAIKKDKIREGIFSLIFDAPADPDILDFIRKFVGRHEEILIRYRFLVENEDSLEMFSEWERRYELEDVEYLPVYRNNHAFFEKFVFFTEEDIRREWIPKKEVYAHQVLNTNDFGKLTILPDGEVYANLNYEPLGNIYRHSLQEMVNKELEEGKSWLRIRNQSPCTVCVYQWLCPSPTNYEEVIPKNNLCHVKK